MNAPLTAPRREVTAPRRILSTSSAGRAMAVVDSLLDDAATKGERAVAWTRIVIGLVVVMIWPLFVWDELREGRLSTWATFLAAPTGVASSFVILRYLRRRRLTLRMQLVSVTLDVVLIAFILLPYPFLPGPTYDNATGLSGMTLMILATVAGGVRLSRRVSVYSAMVNLVLLWTIAAVDYRLGHHHQLLFDYTLYSIYIVTAGTLAFLAAARTRELVLGAATQTLAHERTRALLGAYVSEEVAEASLAQDEIRLGGHRQEVAVLFSDLRGFTTYSEALPPEELVSQLNRYLEVMVACIRAHGGVVDKYIGDAIMAVFGAPTGSHDDAARAMRAATSMRAALVSHNHDRQRRGQPPLAQGVGVHFGAVVAGNVGTSERAAYTVVGDVVNLASRLESATKEQGTDVLFSKALVDAAGRVRGEGDLPSVRSLGMLTVRGREQPVEIFTLA